MLGDLRIKILYQLKILECRFQAWIKIFEISKAYSQQKKPAELNRFMQKFWKLVYYMVFLILGTGVVWGIFRLVQLKPISNPEAAIFTRTSDQSTAEFPGKDTLIKKDDPLSVDYKHEDRSTGSFSEALKKDSAIMIREPVNLTPVEYFVILANKANKTMYLLHNVNGNWQVHQSFNMGTGAQAGRKKTAGDKRTPEGCYFIIERKEKRELTSIYGPLAYVLDYPNQEDRQEGRTGQGIWIHGTEPDSSPGETKGCLEIANDQLLQLSSILKDGIGTPVVIVDKPGVDDPLMLADFALIDSKREVLLAQRKLYNEEFKSLLESWQEAWESMDINRYKEFYDTSGFKSQGVNWKGWVERKIRTFEIYSTIDVTIDRIMVVDNTENSVTLKFLQIYKSDKNSLENGKQMVLEKKNGSWKITREVTIPKEELLL